MKNYFKGVSKHIGKLDAAQLREQFRLATDELEFFDTLLRTIDRGLLAVDGDGRVAFSNPCAQELLGMAPEDAVRQLEIPSGKASRRTFEVTYPEPRALEMTTTPMKNGLTLVFLRDVTAERAHTEAELQAGATRAVRDLASGVAHEIGNPLNALSLNLQLLARAYPDDESIGVCLSQIKRLDGILKGFLPALRPSKPNLMPGSLAEPLAGCLTAFQQQFEERRISVTLDVPAALPPVALDRAQLEQVFFNLVKNALEAMKDGDRLDASVGADDEWVWATLKDSGAGMDAETLAHLFAPYRTTKEHGTGLGLMISKRIVSDHGGTIDVASAPGAGTTFTVKLPRLEKRIRRLA